MRGFRLWTNSGEIYLTRAHDKPPAGTRLAPADASSRVRSWMERHPSTMLEAYEALSVSSRLHSLSRAERDARVQRALEDAFHHGELVATSIPMLLVRAIVERVEEPALGPETTTNEEAQKDFFEATLKDAQGKAAAGVKYKLRTPDGQWREGKTDASGKIRVDDIDRGYCELSFHP